MQKYGSNVPHLSTNIGKTVKTQQAAHPPLWGSFLDIQIDFVLMPKDMGFKYILVLDMFQNGLRLIHAGRQMKPK